MEEFREAMKKIMGEVDDEDLDIIFMKVDTNCDGSVDWDEYLNYMLLEYREKDSLHRQNRPLFFPKPLKLIPVAHCEVIVRIQFYHIQTRQAEKKENKMGLPLALTRLGRYMSISRDGFLSYWSDRFKLIRTVHIDQLKRKQAQQIWVTDMVCMSNMNMLAISSTDRDIEFFDISASKCDRLFSLTGLDNFIIVMHYWTDGKKGVFSIGDGRGNILVLTSLDVVRYGLFNTPGFSTTSGGSCRIPIQSVFKNTSSVYSCYKVNSLLNDLCRKIQFIPELNAVITCSACDQTAMVLTTLPHANKSRIQNSTFFLRKGILCFDYTPEWNLIVTGGFDRIVRMWNPYMTITATSQMKGHNSAITHIVVNGKANKIISISKDKNLRVWDLEDCTCLQNIHSRNMNLGRFPISDIHYNKETNTLSLATFLIGVLQGAIEDAAASFKGLTSHEQPLCAALYNSNFKQVVSGCHNGLVSVWDILTGEKVMQFLTSSEKGVEVTAMTFDGPKRRLITGSMDGTIKLWNFNNGACLWELPKFDNTEVTGILYLNQRIYVSGWSKYVMWYLDAKEDDELEYRQWKRYHSEDIFSMDMHGNKLLVTASYSGDIIVWNIDSGQAFCRFNPYQSPQPLLPVRVSEEVKPVQDKSPNHAEDLTEPWANLRKSVLTDASSSSTLSSQHRALDSAPPVMKSSSPANSKQDMQNVLNENSLVVDRKVEEETRAKREPTKACQGRKKKREEDSIKEKLEKPRLAVEKVFFLRTRERSPDTAILLSSAADGYIYAWSISHQGGLLGKFLAVNTEETSVSTMSTDEKGQILLTGDTNGYIRIWEIENYCYRVKEEKRPASRDGVNKGLRLPDLIPEYCRMQGPKSNDIEAEKEVQDGWTTSPVPPKLLSSWRCHLQRIVHVEYVDRFQLIVTASLDCNVRLWSIAGKYIGTFGQALWQVRVQPGLPTQLPADLKRVASCQTLKVLNEGTRPHWKCAKKILEMLSHQKQQHSQTFHFMKGTMPQDARSKLQEILQNNPVIANYTNDQINITWKKWEVKGEEKSNILGRWYKQKVRHILPPTFPEVHVNFSSREQLRIYKLLPCTALTPVCQPPVPDLLKEAQQLKRTEGSEMIGKQKRSIKTPGRVRFNSNTKTDRKKSTAPKSA
ncbi:WD repeat-containing protein on Y chromosome-like [Polyodon spathula]|uniref:WD repeat-containing protein on Y chromosome-like n=1 Tax=Polyodon spathula TaxID=7913 RepID=UPI001B7E19F6|nr:WD repeat-containing protein on Y chromosome-like [Polyodon spathula]